MIPVIAQVSGVIAGTIDQCRFSTAQERSAYQIHASGRNDPTIMTDHSFTIENRQLEPGIIGTVAGGPDDCLNLSAGEVQTERRSFLYMGGRQPVGRLGRVVQTVRVRPLVDEV